MLKKLAVASCAVLLLSGCAGKKSMSSSVDAALVADFERNVGDRVFFGYDKSTLTQEAHATIARQAAWLQSHDKINVTVEGHCDDRGTREYNLALGERRAAAAAKALEAKGIHMSKIETVSYGKERPAVLGTDESVWGKNRRAVTVLR
jgi:peptidoglycan-associated lipoprotein